MLRLRHSLLLSAVLGSPAAGQTKMTGIARCERPDVQHSLEVGDPAAHMFSISHTKCTWTKPYEIEGIRVQTCSITSFSETAGNSSRYRGYYTDTMENGDKLYYQMEGMVALKAGSLESATESWTLVSGTGKLAGLRAKGTCRAQPNADGSTSWTCEGTYERPK